MDVDGASKAPLLSQKSIVYALSLHENLIKERSPKVTWLETERMNEFEKRLLGDVILAEDIGVSFQGEKAHIWCPKWVLSLRSCFYLLL